MDSSPGSGELNFKQSEESDEQNEGLYENSPSFCSLIFMADPGYAVYNIKLTFFILEYIRIQ